MLGERPAADITIREITSRAEVSYPTFFRSYASKTDILSDIGTIEAHELLADMLEAAKQRDPMVLADAVCVFVDRRRQLWRILLASSAAFTMREVYSVESLQYAASHPQMRPELPLDLVSSFIVSSMFDVLTWWLVKNPEVTQETAAGYLHTLVLQPAMGNR